jgi:glycosyltransferase involved in cell wall biosynthesis
MTVSMPSTPISICIPTYNRARFLKECIESVLMQNYSLYELIICDNQSTDNTRYVVKAFNDSRIKYYYNEQNFGLWGNHNECIKRANHDWILFLHSDEVLKQNAVLSMANEIETENRIAFQLGVIVSLPDRPAMAEFCKQSFYSNKLNNAQALLAIINGIGNPSGMCFSKTALQKINAYDTSKEIYYYADHKLLALIVNAGFDIQFTLESYIHFEVGEHQATAALKSKDIFISNQQFIKTLESFRFFNSACDLYLLYFNQWSVTNQKRMIRNIVYIKSGSLKMRFIAKATFYPKLFFSSSFLKSVAIIILGQSLSLAIFSKNQ